MSETETAMTWRCCSAKRSFASRSRPKDISASQVPFAHHDRSGVKQRLAPSTLMRQARCVPFALPTAALHRPRPRRLFYVLTPAAIRKLSYDCVVPSYSLKVFSSLCSSSLSSLVPFSLLLHIWQGPFFRKKSRGL